MHASSPILYCVQQVVHAESLLGEVGVTIVGTAMVCIRIKYSVIIEDCDTFAFPPDYSVTPTCQTTTEDAPLAKRNSSTFAIQLRHVQYVVDLYITTNRKERKV